MRRTLAGFVKDAELIDGRALIRGSGQKGTGVGVDLDVVTHRPSESGGDVLVVSVPIILMTRRVVDPRFEAHVFPDVFR
ncbi:MAG: hypothetical protein ACKVHO_00150 [Verrucomicrobiia bacterium]|jgi:hypothetical protein